MTQIRSKVHNLVSVHPKSVKLGQMTTFEMIFHVVVFIDWLKFESQPSSLPKSKMNNESKETVWINTRLRWTILTAVQKWVYPGELPYEKVGDASRLA